MSQSTILPLGSVLKDGKHYRQVVHIRHYKRKGICMIKKKSKLIREDCGKKVCKPHSIKIPGECVAGKREVITKCQKPSKNASGGEPGECKQEVKRELESCEGCCPSVEVKVLPCKKGKRLVVKRYWKNVNNCCKLTIVKRRFRCGGCPKNDVALGSCVLNMRLKILTWHFRLNKLSPCESDTVVETVPCSHEHP